MPRFCRTCREEILDEADNSGRFFCGKHGVISISRTTESLEELRVRRRVSKKHDTISKNHVRLNKKWSEIIWALYKNGLVVFSKQQIIDDAVGKDIAKLAHKDLKQLGIKTRYYVQGTNGILELKK